MTWGDIDHSSQGRGQRRTDRVCAPFHQERQGRDDRGMGTFEVTGDKIRRGVTTSRALTTRPTVPMRSGRKTAIIPSVAASASRHPRRRRIFFGAGHGVVSIRSASARVRDSDASVHGGALIAHSAEPSVAEFLEKRGVSCLHVLSVDQRPDCPRILPDRRLRRVGTAAGSGA